MGKASAVPTRVAADVATTAKAVAPAENRSAAEQISHWARIGMQVERSGSLANRRVLAVAAGREQFSALTGEERVAAHALVDARISELAAAQSFGATTRDEGYPTVSLDEDGNLVEIGPDGSRRPL